MARNSVIPCSRRPSMYLASVTPPAALGCPEGRTHSANAQKVSSRIGVGIRIGIEYGILIRTRFRYRPRMLRYGGPSPVYACFLDYYPIVSVFRQERAQAQTIGDPAPASPCLCSSWLACQATRCTSGFDRRRSPGAGAQGRRRKEQLVPPRRSRRGSWPC